MFESRGAVEVVDWCPPPEDELPPWLLPDLPDDVDVDALLAAELTRAASWVPDLNDGELLVLAETEPDHGRATVLAHRIDPHGLDEAAQVRYLQLVWRLENQAAALRLTAVAVVAGPRPVTDTERREDHADTEVGAALNLSWQSGAKQVHAARQLAAHLPATWAALRAGRISGWQAILLAEETYQVDPALLARVEELALTEQTISSPGRLRTAVQRAIARVAPDALAAQEEAAREDSNVTVVPAGDGTADLYADRVPATDAAIIATAVDAYARSAKAAGDARTLGQLRVAALVDWSSSYLTGPHAPTSHGRPVTVQVTMGLDTFLGLSDQPAEVSGGALIPADVARSLVKDATLRRLVLDPLTGHLLDYGRTTYRAPAHLAEAVAARYVTTTGPGSAAPARTGDLDHDVPWDHGGTTSWRNLHPPGRRHHNSKTRAGWTTTICQCGTVLWRTAKGATYRVEPHDYRLGP